MFIDQVKVYARAGHGGRGAVAFLRETFRPKGGPSGGNGGRGGDVVLEGDHDLNNLIEQYYKPRLTAGNGQGGLGKGMDGAGGRDLIVKVPCGTSVWKANVSSRSGDDASQTTDTSPVPRIASSSFDRPVIRRAHEANPT